MENANYTQNPKDKFYRTPFAQDALLDDVLALSEKEQAIIEAALKLAVAKNLKIVADGAIGAAHQLKGIERAKALAARFKK